VQRSRGAYNNARGAGQSRLAALLFSQRHNPNAQQSIANCAVGVEALAAQREANCGGGGTRDIQPIPPGADRCQSGGHCAAGTRCHPDGKSCYPANAEACTGGGYCAAGTVCSPGGQCMPAHLVIGQAGGQRCGAGRCSAGMQCHPSGDICIPGGTVACGTGYCAPGSACGGDGRCFAANAAGTIGAAGTAGRPGSPPGSVRCSSGIQCQPGTQCHPSGTSCYPAGALVCGNTYCNPGMVCTSDGRCTRGGFETPREEGGGVGTPDQCSREARVLLMQLRAFSLSCGARLEDISSVERGQRPPLSAPLDCRRPLVVTSQATAFEECLRVYVCGRRTAQCVEDTARARGACTKEISDECLNRYPVPSQ
jgi:hypothetical protein